MGLLAHSGNYKTIDEGKEMITEITIGFNESIIIIHPNKKVFRLLPTTDGGQWRIQEIKHRSEKEQDTILSSEQVRGRQE